MDYGNLSLPGGERQFEGDWLECLEEGGGIYLCNDGRYRCEACERAYEERLLNEAKLREQSLEVKDVLLRLRSAFPVKGELTVLLS